MNAEQMRIAEEKRLMEEAAEAERLRIAAEAEAAAAFERAR